MQDAPTGARKRKEKNYAQGVVDLLRVIAQSLQQYPSTSQHCSVISLLIGSPKADKFGLPHSGILMLPVGSRPSIHYCQYRILETIMRDLPTAIW